jgi:hypothetical protein
MKGMDRKMLDLLDAGFWRLSTKNNTYKKIFIPNFINNKRLNLLFQDSRLEIKPAINIVSRLSTTSELDDADFILVPHPWVDIKNNHQYLNYLQVLSQKTPLLIANTDDISPKCDLPNTLELRTFLHPKEPSWRKIIIPYPVKSKKFKLRTWKPIPKISFIGYIPRLSMGSLTSKSRAFFKSPLKSSVYANRKLSAINLNKLNKKFEIICIEKSQFTLIESNPNLILEIKQFEDNLMDSDYILCPRGFANTTMRFYETLSSGATPILVDSGSQLPLLRNNMFWSNNILSVNLFSDWAHQIENDWKFLEKSNHYSERQFENNRTFVNELDLQKYLEILFFRYLYSKN